MKKLLAILFCFAACLQIVIPSHSQNIGIGTTVPRSKAILDVQSTNKGVLFPRMTTAQRNLITDIPYGLHIFNTDDRCLNYFDSLYQVWNCYCDDCKIVVINITADACEVDFYNTYAKGAPAKKYLVNIAPGVVISGCAPGDTAFTFTTMPFNAAISINNRGTIQGAGGSGGDGALELGCSSLAAYATPGKPGGSAVATKTGVLITINNYGIIGGGGGGSGGNPTGVGGGGGGGAGIVFGPGGLGGGRYTSGAFGCYPNRFGTAGNPGTATTGGAGGGGTSGGAQGGNGGNRGLAGQNGIGNLSLIASGGAAGKAITGGTANVVTNLSGGQSFGVVD